MIRNDFSIKVWLVCKYIAILKPRGLRQSGSSSFLGNGQSRVINLQVSVGYDIEAWKLTSNDNLTVVVDCLRQAVYLPWGR